MCLYAQFLSHSFVPDSIKNYLSGVKLLHIILGFEYPFSGNILLNLTLRGISRGAQHTPRRANPITPLILIAIQRVVDFTCPLQSSVFATALLLFSLMLRLGNVLPPSINSFSPSKFLTKSRISVTDEGLLVSLMHTKTLQFGNRILHLPVLRVHDSVLCPVTAYTHALTFSSGSDSGPLFSFSLLGHSHVLTKDLFIKTFRALAQQAGVSSPSSFTGHSFRRGGASFAFQVGIPGEYIQIAGDWASDCYKSYLDVSMEAKLNFANIFSSYLRSSQS